DGSAEEARGSGRRAKPDLASTGWDAAGNSDATGREQLGFQGQASGIRRSAGEAGCDEYPRPAGGRCSRKSQGRGPRQETGSIVARVGRAKETLRGSCETVGCASSGPGEERRGGGSRCFNCL